MREPYEDRVLEHALEQVLGEPAQPDLTERILQAWRRGVPGSVDVAELDLDTLPAPPTNGLPASSLAGQRRELPRPHSRAWPARAVLGAAAAVMLLAALVWQLRRTAPAAAPFAVAASEIELLSGAELRARDGTEIRLGDAVLVESGPLRIRMADGTELSVAGGTVLVAREREESPAFELVLGSLELRTGPDPFWLTADFAGIRALPGSELTARVDLDQPGVGAIDETLAGLARTLLGPDSSDRRSLSMNVTHGSAEFEHDGARLTVVPTRGPRTVTGPVLLAESDIERFDTLFAELCLQGEVGMYERKGYAARLLAMEQLSDVLARSVPLWSRLAASVAEQQADPSLPRAFLGNVIDFLHTDPSAESLALASDLWLEAPERFLERHLVTFAERGAFEFDREIEAMVEMYEPVEPFEEPPVLAATYLAVRGNAAGRDLLAESAVAIRSIDWIVPWGMLAALGLDELGDPYAWKALGVQIQNYIRKYLEGGELILASRTLLQYEYFDQLRESAETPILGTVQRDALRQVDVRANEVQTEFEILELMDELFD